MSESVIDLRTFRDELSVAIADMFYISESEAGLELLPPEPSLRSQTAVLASLNGATEEEAGADFLEKLRNSIDPDDQGLQVYIGQWEKLFRLLRSADNDVRIYRSGTDPVEIRIVTIVSREAVILKTSAVET